MIYDKGDYDKMWIFAKDHRGLILSVVLPLFALFRFPGPALAALRLIPNLLIMVMNIMVRVRMPVYRIWHYLWRKTIAIARRRVRKKKRRRR